MIPFRAWSGAGAALLLAASPAAAAPIQSFRMAVNDMVYDPGTKQIWASVDGPSWRGGEAVVSINPDTAGVVSAIGVNGVPGKLAIADQGRYLYAALNGGASVVRLDTVERTAGLQFSTDNGSGANAVDDMAVVPGHPESVVLSLARTITGPMGTSLRGSAGITVEDNGAPRLAVAPGGGSLAFLDGTNRLYNYNGGGSGSGFRRMTVDASGVNVQDVTPGLISGDGVVIKYDQGLLLTSTGPVIDPEARLRLGTFTGLGAGAPVAPDVAQGRVYYLAGADTAATLLAFDPHTFLRIAAWEIPGVGGRVGGLIRWGRERADGGGLAFWTSTGQVFLIYLNQLDHHPVDFSLRPDIDPYRHTPGGGKITVEVRLTAPAPVDGATLQLSSSNPSVAGVPAAVMIPAGAISGAFPVTTSPVTAATSVTITALTGDASHTALLTLSPPELASLVMMGPSPVRGDATLTGTVTLTGPAPAGGVAIRLSGEVGATATVPMVTVPAGATMASFPVVVHGRPSFTLVSVFASLVNRVPDGVNDVTGSVEVGPALPILSAAVYNPANGHWYQEAQVPGTGISWPLARAAAEQLTFHSYPGHLATITSAAENQFIHTQVPHANDPRLSHWLGGCGPGGVSAPYPGWSWITGEPWSYASFYGPEPRPVSTGLAQLGLNANGSWSAVEETPAAGAGGFIIEYEPPQPPGQPPASPPLAPAPPQLILFPNPVFGGQLAEGLAIWPDPATSAPGSILTSSNPAAGYVPPVATAPTGDSVSPFVINTLPVSDLTPITITADTPGGKTTATLEVAAPLPPLVPALSPPSRPAAPTGLTAAQVISFAVLLTWTDHGEDETGYAVWRQQGAAGWVRAGLLPPHATVFMDTGLAPGASYTYRVCAINQIRASGWSNEVTVTVPGI